MVRTLYPRYSAPLPIPPRPPRIHLRLQTRPHQYSLPSRRAICPRHDRPLRRRHRSPIYQEPHPGKQNLDRPRHRHAVYRLRPSAETATAADAAFVPPVETASGDDYRDAHNALRRLAYRTARGGYQEWH